MRPTYTPEAEAYREKVQAFLAEKLPASWKGIGGLDGHDLETLSLSGECTSPKVATWHRVGQRHTAAVGCRRSNK